MVSGTNNEPNRFNENQWQNEYENKSTAINKIRASFRACLPACRSVGATKTNIFTIMLENPV